MKKVEIKIEGMSCGHCTKSAHDFLEEMNGVISVNVNLEKKNAIIELDDNQLSIEKLLQTFNEELPYKATF
jgi:copper chaperone CopZ